MPNPRAGTKRHLAAEAVLLEQRGHLRPRLAQVLLTVGREEDGKGRRLRQWILHVLLGEGLVPASHRHRRRVGRVGVPAAPAGRKQVSWWQYPGPGASPEPPGTAWRHVALSPAVASMAALCEALAVLLPVVDAIILPRLVEVLELSCRPLGRRDIVLHVRLQERR